GDLEFGRPSACRFGDDVGDSPHLDPFEQGGELEISRRDIAGTKDADAVGLAHFWSHRAFAAASERDAKRSRSLGLSCSITRYFAAVWALIATHRSAHGTVP